MGAAGRGSQEAACRRTVGARSRRSREDDRQDERGPASAMRRPGCCRTTARGPTTVCAATCAATTTTTRSTSSSSAAGPAARVLAQRLARRGWRVVAFDAGPFWDPDTRLGQRRGRIAPALLERAPGDLRERPRRRSATTTRAGASAGSMVHFAGYAPRFHPSDFHTLSTDGVGRRLAHRLRAISSRTTS